MTDIDPELPLWRRIQHHSLFPAFVLAFGLAAIVVAAPVWMPLLFGSESASPASLIVSICFRAVSGAAWAMIALVALWAASSSRPLVDRVSVAVAGAGVLAVLSALLQKAVWSEMADPVGEAIPAYFLMYAWWTAVPVWLAGFLFSVYVIHRRSLSLATLLVMTTAVALLLAATRAELQRSHGWNWPTDSWISLGIYWSYAVLFVCLLYWRQPSTDILLLVVAVGLGALEVYLLSDKPTLVVAKLIDNMMAITHVLTSYAVLRGAIELGLVDWRSSRGLSEKRITRAY